MNFTLSYLCAIIIVLLFLSACNKDKLVDELDQFEGTYEWEYSLTRQNWWSTNATTSFPADHNYTAAIKFDNKGKITFYIDGDEIHKTGYSIESQETSEDGNTIWLTVSAFKENSKNLDLNDNVGFSLTNDTLVADDFPGQSYDSDFSGSHYFIRK